MKTTLTRLLCLSILIVFAGHLPAQSVVGHENFGARRWVMIYENTRGEKETVTGDNTLFSQTLATFIDFEVPLDQEQDGIRDGRERRFWFWRHRPLADFRIPLMKVDSITETCDTPAYQTVFREEFSGDRLDTTLWYPNFATDTIGSLDFPCWYLPSMVKVENGLLKLGLQYFEEAETRTFNVDGRLITDTRNHYAGAIVSRTPPDAGPRPAGGCWQFGRYTFRAKLAEPKTAAAIWFFGWPGEADLIEVRPENQFKRLVHGYHAWNVVDDCDRDVTQYGLQATIPAQRECPPRQIADWHLLINRSSTNPATLYTEFHEFTYEWTPFKQLFMVDGVVRLEVFRYYEVRFVRGNAFLPDILYLRGLDCNEIPTNTLLPKVWENLAWNRMSRFGMDMILSQGAEKRAATPDRDFEVDWIRVAQRKGDNWGLRTLTGASVACPGEVVEFTLDKGNLENATTWSLPEHLELITSDDSTLVARAVSAGVAEVEARFNNPFSCYDVVLREPFQIGSPSVDTVFTAYRKCHGYHLSTDLGAFAGTPRWEISRSGRPLEVYEDTLAIFVPVEPGEAIGYRLEFVNACGNEAFTGTLSISLAECDEAELRVYPNPARDVANYYLGASIRAELPDAAPTITLRLFNTEGETVRTYLQRSAAGTLDLRDLRAGVYLLTAETASQRLATHKIVKY